MKTFKSFPRTVTKVFGIGNSICCSPWKKVPHQIQHAQLIFNDHFGFLTDPQECCIAASDPCPIETIVQRYSMHLCSICVLHFWRWVLRQLTLMSFYYLSILIHKQADLTFHRNLQNTYCIDLYSMNCRFKLDTPRNIKMPRHSNWHHICTFQTF